jgi:hypothetical protein
MVALLKRDLRDRKATRRPRVIGDLWMRSTNFMGPGESGRIQLVHDLRMFLAFRFMAEELHPNPMSGLNPVGNKSRALSRIPVVALAQVLAGRKVPVILDVQAYEDGMLPWEQSVALLCLINLAQPSVVLEIGTYMGFTAKAMARNLPHAVIHTLDLPFDYDAGADPVTDFPKDDFHLIKKRVPGREFLQTAEATRIHQHFGDSATWDFSQAAGANCFFIDGSHTYDYCRLDSEKCHELCGGKGLFLWHDCDNDHPGVVKLITEWIKMGRNIALIEGTCLAYWQGQ